MWYFNYGRDGKGKERQKERKKERNNLVEGKTYLDLGFILKFHRSEVVQWLSISACHADDRGSIPRFGDLFAFYSSLLFLLQSNYSQVVLSNKMFKSNFNYFVVSSSFSFHRQDLQHLFLSSSFLTSAYNNSLSYSFVTFDQTHALFDTSIYTLTTVYRLTVNGGGQMRRTHHQ